MKTRHAACSCGRLRATTHGEPHRVSICHCLACQRRTGSVFGLQARFHAHQLTSEGTSREYRRIAESGDAVRFHFCPDCGATVFYFIEALPDTVSVPVGAFADPGFAPPTVAVYAEHRHRWLSLPDTVRPED